MASRYLPPDGDLVELELQLKSFDSRLDKIKDIHKANKPGLGKCLHLRVKSMPLAFTGIFRINPEYSGITWHFHKNNS